MASIKSARRCASSASSRGTIWPPIRPSRRWTSSCPQRAHLPGAGVAEARVVDLPLCPQGPRLPDARGGGDRRALGGFLLRRRQKVSGLCEKADLEAVRPGLDQSRATPREDRDRQDREAYGRGRGGSGGPLAGGRPEPPQQKNPPPAPRPRGHPKPSNPPAHHPITPAPP